MWKDFISKLNSDINIEFNAPASENELLETEKALNIELPEWIKKPLLETNGFKNDSSLWSAYEIKENNIYIRDSFKEYFMPLDCFLFFGDAGNGDYFGFPIINGEIWKGDVYVWNHEDDSRTWVASSLKGFLKAWLCDEIST